MDISWFPVGFVMMLQFRYQRAKLYRQIAMGKKHHLSVSQGIKLHTNLLYVMSSCFADMTVSNLKILIMFLIIVYVFQFYNGYTLLKLWLWSPAIDCDFFQVIMSLHV